MAKQNLADELLRESVLSAADAARLILEMEDALGRRVKRRSRGSLMQLFRHVIQAGASSIAKESRTVSLETAAWASVESRTRHLRPVSARDLRYYVRKLLRTENCAKLMLRSITPMQCRCILQSAFGDAGCAFVKGRSILHSIFTYGMRQEWCDSNPVSLIEIPRIREKIIEPLSIDEVTRLLQCARDTDMQLSLNLMLFGGIRPTEVARLTPDDICWNEKLVFIRPLTSKTGGGRVVPLRGSACICPRLRTIPSNWQRRWQALRAEAGFHTWVPDICRHTFATYHAGYFRNLPALQLEMGHSNLNLLRSRYMRPVFSSDARKFWALVEE